MPDDVVQALEPAERPGRGRSDRHPAAATDQPFQYTINLLGRLDQVSQFEDIIVKSATTGGGQLVRIRDMARVELGAQTYSTSPT